jgi:F-type H+-transporting ATPase subunit b
VILGSNFLVPNGTFIIELAAFLIVLAVLGKYVLPPLNQRLEERQEVLRQGLADAEEAKRRAAEAEQAYREQIDAARAEARALIDEANRLGEQLRSELRARGEEEYERIIGRAEADISASARRASEELRGQVTDLVVTVVERVIGERFDDAAQRAIIDRTIAEVEGQLGRAPEVTH